MLVVKNVHKVYDNGKSVIEVLKGIDLTVKENEFVSITGPSGAGKSTLLHILGGLDLPTKGEVSFQGEHFSKLSDSALSRIRNKKIGFVFQFYHLLSEFNVLENIIMPARISVISQEERNNSFKRAKELLTEAGLEKRMHHFPTQLSGGEKQRVALVRALINKPQILFCDEPTGNLDSKTGIKIMELIQSIKNKEGMSVVLVTHNPDLAKEADKAYHLKDGMLVS